MNKKVLAFIYNKKKDKFLAIKTNGRQSKKHGKSRWFTVTGSIEKGETPEQAVKREIKEETNLGVMEILDLKLGCRYVWQKQIYEERYFIAFINSNNIKLDGIELINYKWLKLKEFVNLIEWSTNKDELNTFLKKGIEKDITHPFARIDDLISRDRSIFVNNGKESHLTWHKTKNFSKLANVRQVYGICFDNSGKILIIKIKKNWSLPGGTPEKGESYEQTLKREVDEEGDVDIKNLIPLGYNKIIVFNKNKTKKEIFYQLRYIAKIARIKKQTPDPAYNIIPQRKFINPKDFFKYCPWGAPAEKMMNEALNI